MKYLKQINTCSSKYWKHSIWVVPISFLLTLNYFPPCCFFVKFGKVLIWWILTISFQSFTVLHDVSEILSLLLKSLIWNSTYSWLTHFKKLFESGYITPPVYVCDMLCITSCLSLLCSLSLWTCRSMKPIGKIDSIWFNIGICIFFLFEN